MTAAALTFLIVQKSIPGRWWLDATILAAAQFAALMVVIYNLMPMFNSPPLCDGRPFEDTKPPLFAIIVVCTFIGTAIGGTIPNWLRKKQQEIHGLDDAVTAAATP